jgi:hypothetical protein
MLSIDEDGKEQSSDQSGGESHGRRRGFTFEMKRRVREGERVSWERLCIAVRQRLLKLGYALSGK